MEVSSVQIRTNPSTNYDTPMFRGMLEHYVVCPVTYVTEPVVDSKTFFIYLSEMKHADVTGSFTGSAKEARDFFSDHSDLMDRYAGYGAFVLVEKTGFSTVMNGQFACEMTSMKEYALHFLPSHRGYAMLVPEDYKQQGRRFNLKMLYGMFSNSNQRNEGKYQQADNKLIDCFRFYWENRQSYATVGEKVNLVSGVNLDALMGPEFKFVRDDLEVRSIRHFDHVPCERITPVQPRKIAPGCTRDAVIVYTAAVILGFVSEKMDLVKNARSATNNTVMTWLTSSGLLYVETFKLDIQKSKLTKKHGKEYVDIIYRPVYGQKWEIVASAALAPMLVGNGKRYGSNAELGRVLRQMAASNKKDKKQLKLDPSKREIDLTVPVSLHEFSQQLLARERKLTSKQEKKVKKVLDGVKKKKKVARASNKTGKWQKKRRRTQALSSSVGSSESEKEMPKPPPLPGGPVCPPRNSCPPRSRERKVVERPDPSSIVPVVEDRRGSLDAKMMALMLDDPATVPVIATSSNEAEEGSCVVTPEVLDTGSSTGSSTSNSEGLMARLWTSFLGAG
jgi:hypothetical protein